MILSFHVLFVRLSLKSSKLTVPLSYFELVPFHIHFLILATHPRHLSLAWTTSPNMSESMSDSKDGSRQQSQNESPQVSVGNADLSSLSPPTASAGWHGTQRNTRDGQNGCSTCNHRAASRNSGGAMGNQGVQRRGNEEIVAPSTVQIPNGMAGGFECKYIKIKKLLLRCCCKSIQKIFQQPAKRLGP
jgi:hypothetical protein